MPVASAVEYRPEGVPLGDLARDIYARSLEQWGGDRSTALVGRHPSLACALERVVRCAASESPVLVTGETGTGKELFARALYLTSRRRHKPFLTVNCAQYASGDLIASELFGHRRGSFTGAVADRRGIFEEADGGVVFLDEIGELPPSAQAMLLRVLSEGEVVPVGENRARRVDVRVVAATSRELLPMIAAGTFRSDLYYRLRFLHVQVPPLRERGDDWALIAHHYLERLSRSHASRKAFSTEVVRCLERHSWPGNVREVRGFVDTGFHLSEGALIRAEDLGEALMDMARDEQMHGIPLLPANDFCARMAAGDLSFWEAVHRPFLDRDLNRGEVRAIVARGLDVSRGSYKRLLEVFGLKEEEYLKFMDFLRHHDLKPEF